MLLNDFGNEANETHNTLHRNVQKVIYGLELWCGQYNFGSLQPGLRRSAGSISFHTDAPDLQSHHCQPRAYDSVCFAVCTALHNAANLLAYSLLLLTQLPTDENNHRLQFYAQSVLSIDAFVKSQHYPGPNGAALLMLFPLRVIMQWSPLPLQRLQAAQRLYKWDYKNAYNTI